ncbi:hypothetical protein FJ546_22545 [Mesorhizobium sp. B2-4-19]|uniref:hypothetical protein n=1 Tax=Mesorhizobium sp. B2-4-19 TaxID=2589930 RepID=UPI00112D5F4F|nr:hypothetical protein [Mesorhizobium sp. B2-4-19]TPK58757.1 hypothetical protein FJ546_22545 [Mesorhizobium sp. B2-4-19]
MTGRLGAPSCLAADAGAKKRSNGFAEAAPTGDKWISGMAKIGHRPEIECSPISMTGHFFSLFANKNFSLRMGVLP